MCNGLSRLKLNEFFTLDDSITGSRRFLVTSSVHAGCCRRKYFSLIPGAARAMP